MQVFSPLPIEYRNSKKAGTVGETTQLEKDRCSDSGHDSLHFFVIMIEGGRCTVSGNCTTHLCEGGLEGIGMQFNIGKLTKLLTPGNFQQDSCPRTAS